MGSGDGAGSLGHTLGDCTGDLRRLGGVSSDLEPDSVGALVGQARKLLLKAKVPVPGPVWSFDGGASDRAGADQPDDKKTLFHFPVGGGWFGFLIHRRTHQARVATPMASCSQEFASATHEARDVTVPAVAPTASTLFVTFI
jgi:hypothetical protein